MIVNESRLSLDSLFKKDDYGEVKIIDVSYRQYHVYFDEDIRDPDYYRPVYETLHEANEEDEVVLYINTEGGCFETFTQLFSDLQSTKASTTAKIFQACSAGAYIALACDVIEPQPFCSMMIHSISSSSESTKIQDLKNYSVFTHNQNIEVVNKLCKTFLTPQEIETVLKGGDLWLSEEQIKEKLKKWKSLRQK
jgi:ATP-dependent protease ClpP protease subunit